MVYTKELITDINNIYTNFSHINKTMEINVLDPFTRLYYIIIKDSEGNESTYKLTRKSQDED
jgi:hypothetical protein